MESMRATWTDERLDEFAKRTDERFDRVDQQFEQVDRRFEQVDRRFEQVDRRFEQVERRMDEGFNRVHEDMASLRTEVDTKIDGLRGEMKALYRLTFQMGAGMFATFAIGFIGLIVAQI